MLTKFGTVQNTYLPSMTERKDEHFLQLPGLCFNDLFCVCCEYLPTDLSL